MQIAIAQINPIAGDLTYNSSKIEEYIKKAKEDKVELLIFSTGALIGLNIKNLYLDKTFAEEVKEVTNKILELTDNISIILPSLIEVSGSVTEVNYHIKDKKIIKDYPLSPNHTFSMYEDYAEAEKNCLLKINNKKIYLNLPCYNGDLNLYTLPAVFDKGISHFDAFTEVMPTAEIPFICVSSAGFCNGFVFTGASFGCDNTGKIVYKDKYFEESYSILHLDKGNLTGVMEPDKDSNEKTYKAITSSINDFVKDNKFKGLILGMNGGIDAALVGALAVDAVGADRVRALIMPSDYSSKETMSDAETICKNLGIKYDIIPISNTVKDLKASLETTGDVSSITEQNLQSRVRGILSMALSNETGFAVLTTGNKTESACGYFTMYGESAGSLAPIIDLYKTEVYQLAEYKNSVSPVIPETVIKKPITEELTSNQKDNNALFEYNILDPILEMLIDKSYSVDEVVKAGYNKDTVAKIYNLLHIVEYKRQQYPLGITLTSTALQNEDFWQYPQTNNFRA